MKKTVFFLILYLLLFSSIFFLSLYDYLMKIPLFEIGLPARITNLVVLLLSTIGIIKTVMHIAAY